MLTMQDIEQIKRDAEKAVKRQFEDAADEGWTPTPTPEADGVDVHEAQNANHVLGDSDQRAEVERSGAEQNEQANSVNGEDEIAELKKQLAAERRKNTNLTKKLEANETETQPETEPSDTEEQPEQESEGEK